MDYRILFFFFSDKLNDFFKNITLLPDSHIALRSLGVNFKMHKYFSILASSLERQSDVLGEHRLTSNSSLSSSPPYQLSALQPSVGHLPCEPQSPQLPRLSVI